MAAFHFELVSPEKLLFSGDVESVVVPGSEGQFTVLKDHAPFMTTLRPGIVDIGGAAPQKLFVRGGFADVAKPGLTILAEQAIAVSDLDAARIEAEIKAIEERAQHATSDEAKAEVAEALHVLRSLRHGGGAH
jgi:F-type H+-transporting ATPase subunit epsilon